LPPIHKDPFDRALIAQAIVEGLEMMTLDGEIRLYRSSDFRTIS
jgi:PIN domain nuclease of toxin-antitoxin system